MTSNLDDYGPPGIEVNLTWSGVVGGILDRVCSALKYDPSAQDSASHFTRGQRTRH
ncbi:hypothetical protein M3J09_002457 [Ascochyta lentis]